MKCYIKRELTPQLLRDTPPRAVCVYGPRRIGKSTLLENLVRKEPHRWFNGDMPSAAEELNFHAEGDVLNALLQAKTIVIDEAHKIPNIGSVVKMLVDANEKLETPRKILITSSSAFYLAAVKESALGRVVSRRMWPFSLSELANNSSWGHLVETIEHRIVYGMMPTAVEAPERARSYLTDYCEGYLLRDFFEENVIRYPGKLKQLLKRLAHYVGSVISYDNLAREIGLNRITIEDYIDRLEKASLIRVCHSFSRNLANEMKKGKKIYFFDTGVRNAILNDFSPLSARVDAGALWENFFYMERVKLHDTKEDFKEIYFWRTTGNAPREIDFIEVVDNKIEAFECKVSKAAKAKISKTFQRAYPNTTVTKATPQDIFAIFANTRSNF